MPKCQKSTGPLTDIDNIDNCTQWYNNGIYPYQYVFTSFILHLLSLLLLLLLCLLLSSLLLFSLLLHQHLLHSLQLVKADLNLSHHLVSLLLLLLQLLAQDAVLTLDLLHAFLVLLSYLYDFIDRDGLLRRLVFVVNLHHAGYFRLQFFRLPLVVLCQFRGLFAYFIEFLDLLRCQFFFSLLSRTFFLIWFHIIQIVINYIQIFTVDTSLEIGETTHTLEQGVSADDGASFGDVGAILAARDNVAKKMENLLIF